MSSRFKRELNINVNTNVETKPIQEAEKIVSGFFDKYDGESVKIGIDTKQAKIDVRDFSSMIRQVGVLEEKINKVKVDSPSMLPALKDDIDSLEQFKAELSSAVAIFDDGSIATGFEQIMSKLSQEFHIVAVDLGERIQYLKSQVADVIDELKNIGTIQKNWRGNNIINVDNLDMSEDQIREQINLLEKLQKAQAELELFNGKKFTKEDSPTGFLTDSFQYEIKSLDRTLKALEDYNYRVEEQYKITTEQLRRRKELINEVEDTSWDSESQAEALRNIKDEEQYEQSLADLKLYIENKEALIKRLQENESELFRADGIEEYISQIRGQIQEYQGYISELQNAKNNGEDGIGVNVNLSGIIRQLEEIKKAINDIKTAFEPLTAALASEDSALHQMLTSSIDDLNTLQQKFEYLSQTIDEINKKDFNITQQTVYNTKASSTMQSSAAMSAYKEKAEIMLDIVKKLIAAQETLNKTNPGLYTRGINQLSVQDMGSMSDFFENMAKFNPVVLTGKIASAESTKELKNIIGQLSAFKSTFMGLIDIINTIQPNAIDTSFLSALDEVDEKINKINSGIIDNNNLQKKAKETQGNVSKEAQKQTEIDVNAEEAVSKFKTLSEQIGAELEAIRAKIQETFDFSTLNPNYESIKTITDTIYQQFVELQSKINKLEFKVETPTATENKAQIEQTVESAQAAATESTAMEQVGKNAAEATNQKGKFEEANKKVKQQTDKTNESLGEESKRIANVAAQAESASGGGWDKEQFVQSDYGQDPSSYSRTKTTDQNRYYQTVQERYTRNPDTDELELDTVTFVNNFRKRAEAAVKETTKIKNAQADLLKFMSQFDSKTAGYGKYLTGYSALQNFKIANLSDIETAAKMMMDLDTEYNRVTLDFRKGTSSMNPFVNAINGVQKMEAQITDAETAFKGLNSQPQELQDKLNKLTPLLEAIKYDLSAWDQNGNPKNVDIYGAAQKYGQLRLAINEVTSSISSQRREEALAAKQEKERQKSLKELYGLYDQQAESAAKIVKYREQLASGNANQEDTKALYEKIRAEQQLQQEIQKRIKAYGNLHDAQMQKDTITTKVEDTRSEIITAKKQQELNSLYRKRQSIIDDIINAEKKVNGSNNTAEVQNATNALNLAKQKLQILDQQIASYGLLADQAKLEAQNDQMVLKLRREIAAAQSKKQVNAESLTGRKDVLSSGIAKQLTQWDTSGNLTDAYRQSIKDLQDELSKVVDDEAFAKIQIKWRILCNQISASVTEQKAKTTEAAKQEKEQLEALMELYKKYADAREKITKFDNDTSGKVHDQERAKAMQDMADAAKEMNDAYGVDVTSQETLLNSLAQNKKLTQEQMNTLLEEELKRREQITNLIRQAADAESTIAAKEQQRIDRQNQNYGNTIFNRESRYFENINTKVGTFDIKSLSNDFINKIQAYIVAFEKLKNLRDQFDKNPKAFESAFLKQQFQESAIEVEGLRKSIQGLFKEYDKFSNKPLLGKSSIAPSQLDDARTAMMRFAAEITDGKFKFEKFNATGTEMYGVLNEGNGVLRKITVSLNGVTNEMFAFEAGTKQVAGSWQTLSNEIKSGARQIIMQYVGIQDAIQLFRTGINYVKEIDLAMTELRKVTDETEQTYARFLKTAASTAGKIGSTISEFTQATSDFARLGYTINESANMAEAALVYTNVGDEIDSVDEATQSIISTMKAFGITANNTMGIVDRFNEVGNRFAITSGGIGDALQRSASALNEAGNTLDESIALVTAANSVVQNPEQVGEMLADYKVA